MGRILLFKKEILSFSSIVRVDRVLRVLVSFIEGVSLLSVRVSVYQSTMSLGSFMFCWITPLLQRWVVERAVLDASKRFGDIRTVSNSFCCIVP